MFNVTAFILLLGLYLPCKPSKSDLRGSILCSDIIVSSFLINSLACFGDLTGGSLMARYAELSNALLLNPWHFVQHVYITGGSSGLGLALAKALTAQGAHVSIIARNKTKLADALADIEVHSRG